MWAKWPGIRYLWPERKMLRIRKMAMKCLDFSVNGLISGNMSQNTSPFHHQFYGRFLYSLQSSQRFDVCFKVLDISFINVIKMGIKHYTCSGGYSHHRKNGQMSVAHFFANATRCKTSVLPHCFMAISRTNALFSEDLWPTQTSPCWSYHQSFRWSSDQMVGSGWWTNPRNQSENLNKPQVCCLQFFRHG